MTARPDPTGTADVPELFQLDRATCLALLRTQCVGRIVVVSDEVVVLPVNFVAAGERVTLRTEVGGVVDRAAPARVTFEVDMVDERTRSGWSVVVHGPLERVAPPADDVRPWAPGDRMAWLSITVDAITGRLLRNHPADDGTDAAGYL